MNPEKKDQAEQNLKSKELERRFPFWLDRADKEYGYKCCGAHDWISETQVLSSLVQLKSSRFRKPSEPLPNLHTQQVFRSANAVSWRKLKVKGMRLISSDVIVNEDIHTDNIAGVPR